MTLKKRKKRRRSRLSQAGRLARLIPFIALLGIALTVNAASKKKERTAEGIIAGTVFQASGRLLPGAKVEAALQNDPKVRAETQTDIQGDFAIRVPSGRGAYLVTATAKGFQPQEKTVEVFEGEKVRTNIILNPVEPGAKD